jgi:hypothetical protein
VLLKADSKWSGINLTQGPSSREFCNVLPSKGIRLLTKVVILKITLKIIEIEL